MMPAAFTRTSIGSRSSAVRLTPLAGNLQVLGNGTLGRLTKWMGFTSSNAVIGDSIIFEDKFGKVGIGTDAPTSRFTVAGMIETTLGGLKFPDGTVQTTAAASGLQNVFHDATLHGDGTSGSPLGVATPLSLTGSVPRGGPQSFDAVIKATNTADFGTGMSAFGGRLGFGITAFGGDSAATDEPGGAGVFARGGASTEIGGGDGVRAIGGDSNTNGGGGGVNALGGNSLNSVGGTGVYAVGGSGGNGGGTGVFAIGQMSFGSSAGDGIFASGGSGGIGSGGVPGTGGAGLRVSGGNGVGAGSQGGDALIVSRGLGVSGGVNGRAAVLEGNVDITGNLNVTGTKNFRIDHPLDPENKYLYHAAVESSEVLNVYSGNVTTNENGEATIALPDWFEALNRDLRYQLTVIGTFAQAIVAEKVNHNRFTIKTNASNVEVSWQVTGVRSDRSMRRNPFIVEQDKSERERGHYLQPELYDQPEERSVEWGRTPETMRQLKRQRPNAQQVEKQSN
jgi:hypothetical protein